MGEKTREKKAKINISSKKRSEHATTTMSTTFSLIRYFAATRRPPLFQVPPPSLHSVCPLILEFPFAFCERERRPSASLTHSLAPVRHRPIRVAILTKCVSWSFSFFPHHSFSLCSTLPLQLHLCSTFLWVSLLPFFLHFPSYGLLVFLDLFCITK